MSTIACICGSTRQRQEITDLDRQLTMEGKIVLAPGVFGHDGDPMTDEDKERLDKLHLSKIDMSDEVHFIAKPDGTLGESTTREYEYATSCGKRVVGHGLALTPASSEFKINEKAREMALRVVMEDISRYPGAWQPTDGFGSMPRPRREAHVERVLDTIFDRIERGHYG